MRVNLKSVLYIKRSNCSNSNRLVRNFVENRKLTGIKGGIFGWTGGNEWGYGKEIKFRQCFWFFWRNKRTKKSLYSDRALPERPQVKRVCILVWEKVKENHLPIDFPLPGRGYDLSPCPSPLRREGSKKDFWYLCVFVRVSLKSIHCLREKGGIFGWAVGNEWGYGKEIKFRWCIWFFWRNKRTKKSLYSDRALPERPQVKRVSALVS